MTPAVVMQDKESNVKVKGILTAALLIAAVLLLQTAGMALNLDYSGPINSFTGTPSSVKRPWLPNRSALGRVAI